MTKEKKNPLTNISTQQNNDNKNKCQITETELNKFWQLSHAKD